MGQVNRWSKVNGDVVLLVIAVWLGFFLEEYESKNTCPSYCLIEHEHINDIDKNIKESDTKDS